MQQFIRSFVLIIFLGFSGLQVNAQIEMPKLDLEEFTSSKTILVEFNRLNDSSLNAKVQFYDGELIIKKPLAHPSGVSANLPSAGWLIIYMENNGWEYDGTIDLPKKGMSEMERRNSKKYLFRQTFRD